MKKQVYNEIGFLDSDAKELFNKVMSQVEYIKIFKIKNYPAPEGFEKS